MDLISHIKKNIILLCILSFILLIVLYFISTLKHEDNYFKSKVSLLITENNVQGLLPFLAAEISQGVNIHNFDRDNDFIYDKLTYDFSDITFNLKNNSITFKSTHIFDEKDYKKQIDIFVSEINNQFNLFYQTIKNQNYSKDKTYLETYLKKFGSVQDTLNYVVIDDVQKLTNDDFVIIDQITLISSYDHLIIYDYLILLVLSISLSLLISVLTSVFRANNQ